MLETTRGSGVQGMEVVTWSHRSLRWAGSWRGLWAGECRAGLSVSVGFGDAVLVHREWQRAPGCTREPRHSPFHRRGAGRVSCPRAHRTWLRAGWPGSSPAGFKGRLSLASLPGMACSLRHGVTLTFMGSESFSRAAFPQMAVLGEHSAQRAPSLWGAHPRQEQSAGSQGSGSSGSGCSPFPWAVFWELLVPAGTGGSLEPPGSGPEGWGSGGACMEKLLRAGAWHVQPVLPQRVFLGALFSGNVSILSS